MFSSPRALSWRGLTAEPRESRHASARRPSGLSVTRRGMSAMSTAMPLLLAFIFPPQLKTGCPRIAI